MNTPDIENQIVAVEQHWNAARTGAGHHVGDARIIAGAADHERVRDIDETVICIQIAMIKPRARHSASRIRRQRQTRVESAVAEGAGVRILVEIGNAARLCRQLSQPLVEA